MKDEIGGSESRFAKTPKKAAASGWVGSALEYYDFFIYAQAAALVFPTIFFPKTDPQIAIIAAFATFGVGYVARPIGAFVLGHLGDTHGRKKMLVMCMMLIGVSSFLVGVLPTYDHVGLLAPALLVVLRLIQGFAVGGEISGATAMVIEHAPFGRRGYYGSYTLQGVQAGQMLAAAVFLPLSAIMSDDAFKSWGWRIPFLLSVVVVVAGLIIRRRVDETPAFRQEELLGETPKAPLIQAIRESGSDMVRTFCIVLLNVVPITVNTFGATYATNDAYGHSFSTTTYLWISVSGNIFAILLIPFVGNLSDKIGRRPCIIVGAVGSSVMGYLYLYAIESHNIVFAFVAAMLMWGVVFQGYNAAFPTFCQELFPTRTRVTGFAVSQNLALMATAFLPAVFAYVAPPGSNVPVIVGTFVLVSGLIAAGAAYSARETYRLRIGDLGIKGTEPVAQADYERLRTQARDEAKV